MTDVETTRMWRPVGQAEMDLINSSGKFPPRLPGQPVFYPVLDEGYARQIARDWNTRDEASGFIGYVISFKVKSSYLSQFEERTVGGPNHRELWVPAKDLDEFNRNIVGRLTVVGVYRGILPR